MHQLIICLLRFKDSQYFENLEAEKGKSFKNSLRYLSSFSSALISITNTFEFSVKNFEFG